MTSLLEKIVAIIAPHTCVTCGMHNNVWCVSCRVAEHNVPSPVCLICGEPGANWEPCARCAAGSQLRAIWAASVYRGTVTRVIHAFKFERVRDAYLPLAEIMLQALPHEDWLVVPVPTAPPRIRQRGYDQAALLARHIAQARGLAYSPALVRVHYLRQVGKNRMQRKKQSIQMFAIARARTVRGAKVLLVDDVCTTGSTLQAAAHVLREAGAADVSAVVTAWQPPQA